MGLQLGICSLMGRFSPKILGEGQDSWIPGLPCNLPEFHHLSHGPLLGSHRVREEKLGCLYSMCCSWFLWEYWSEREVKVTPVTLEAVCLNISMKQLPGYQFNIFQCNFFNCWCFLFCDVSPTFFLTMLQCDFVCFCFSQCASASIKYIMESKHVFSQWS